MIYAIEIKGKMLTKVNGNEDLKVHHILRDKI